MHEGAGTRSRLLPWVACFLALALWSTPAAPSAAEDGSVLRAFDLRRAAAERFRLPRALREVSGLAMTEDGRLLAHGDERGIVSEVDYRTGAIVKSFSLGAPPVPDDFEGIAVADGRLFLIASGGRLYETREGGPGAAVRYRAYDTGFGARCELEGLAYEPSDRSLLVGCKRPFERALRGSVTLFRWSIDRRAPATPSSLSMPLADIVRATGEKAFHPSSVEREPRTGHYVIVAGPQRLLAEVTPTGSVVATRSLSRALHRQPEGLTFIGDSILAIADEGGSGFPTLTLYRHAR
jgi:uncharacterized protein YjiK